MNNVLKRYALLVVLVLAACSIFSGTAFAKKLNVVTATTDLAALAQEVGGDKINVESIARGYQDPHFVEAKPSFILKLQRADILILVGRDLEIGWLPPLIQQSRNSKVQVGADGYLDASLQARILEVPQGQITRAEGDVHPLGNPHYCLIRKTERSSLKRLPIDSRNFGRATGRISKDVSPISRIAWTRQRRSGSP